MMANYYNDDDVVFRENLHCDALVSGKYHMKASVWTWTDNGRPVWIIESRLEWWYHLSALCRYQHCYVVSACLDMFLTSDILLDKKYRTLDIAVSYCMSVCVQSMMERAWSSGSGSGQGNSLSGEENSFLVSSFAYLSFHLTLPVSLSSPPPLFWKNKSFFPLGGRENIGPTLKGWKNSEGKITASRAEREKELVRESEMFRWRHRVSIMHLIVLNLTYGV